MSNETEDKLAQIKECPNPCNNGMVEINNAKWQKRRLTCPIMSLTCHYGRRIERDLNRCITNIMSDIKVPRRHMDNFAEMSRTKIFTDIDTNKRIESFFKRGDEEPVNIPDKSLIDWLGK